MALQLTVALSGISSPRGSFQTTLEKRLHLEVHQTLTLADITRAQRSCEALSRVLKEQPHRFIELLDVARPERSTQLRHAVAQSAREAEPGDGSESDNPGQNDGEEVDFEEIWFILALLWF